MREGQTGFLGQLGSTQLCEGQAGGVGLFGTDDVGAQKQYASPVMDLAGDVLVNAVGQLAVGVYPYDCTRGIVGHRAMVFGVFQR